MIDVALLQPQDESAYRDFLLRNERSLIYATLEFRNFLAATISGEPVYLIAKRAEAIVGAIPCFRMRAEGVGTVVNSLPWYGSHGGCWLADDGDEEARKALLQAYAELARDGDVLSATLVAPLHEEPSYQVYEAILKPHVKDYRIGQITTLPQSGLDIVSRLELVFRQKTRNLARKALKQGFDLAVDDSDAAWNFLYDTHVENMRGIGGRAKPWAHFQSLREAIPPTQRSLLIAQVDGQSAAALLLLSYNKTIEYFTPVIKHEYRSQQPLSFLIWHGMLRSIEQGFKWWNWGGTWHSQQSLHHFKAGWGADDSPYTYFISATPISVEKVRANASRLGELFPYYYVFPFELLK